VSSQDGEVNLVVRDHGLGVTGPDADQLFKRFFRSAEARSRKIPGTGLGLAVVKGIVDGHGGTVTMTPTPGRGTTMIVQLPAAVRPRMGVRPRHRLATSAGTGSTV
jgi:two-component system OmpR family sensor kinase